jgi:hypothetical protein
MSTNEINSKSEDEEEETESPKPPEKPGSDNGAESPSGSGGEGEIPDLLLELIGVAAKLNVLLLELDQAEFDRIDSRLRVFTKQVADLPQSRPPAKQIGFNAKSKGNPN